jgi:protein-S-isoprenylcysteine O-methyltransferase Ste14
MLGIFIGSIAFIFMLFFDLSTHLNKHTYKYVFLLLSLGLFIIAVVLFLPYNHQFNNDFVYIPVLLPLIVFFFIALIYSVVIEVNIDALMKGHQTQLITKGTYSLVRHPGVIWLFMFMFLTSLYLANYYVLMASFVWTTVNAIYVYFQEKLFLRKMFEGYTAYQHETPMLIPTIKSFTTFTKQTLEE